MAKEKVNLTENNPKDNKIKDIVGTVVYFAAVLGIVYLIIHFVGQRTVVNGSSMEPTLYHSESLVMDKISYRFSDPKRYDIVVFPGPEEEGENPYYIKRIIGLPGETVKIEDGRVYINGELLEEEKYGITDYIDEAGIAAEDLKLADDEYFCMGDNRPVSLDCRYEVVGPVKKSEIIGKIWIRIWPLHKWGNVDKARFGK